MEKITYDCKFGLSAWKLKKNFVKPPETLDQCKLGCLHRIYITLLWNILKCSSPLNIPSVWTTYANLETSLLVFQNFPLSSSVICLFSKRFNQVSLWQWGTNLSEIAFLKLNYREKLFFFPHPFICQRHYINEKVGNRRN